MTTSDTCYRLVVAGRLSQTVTQVIDARFGTAASISFSGTDSTVEFAADQPALRALLTLLWDFGQDLLAIYPYTTKSQPAQADLLLLARSEADPQPGPEPAVTTPTTTRRSATP